MSLVRSGSGEASNAAVHGTGLVGRLAAPRAPPAVSTSMTAYAIISLGGKQYRVHEGQRLLVDRLGPDEGKTFTPDVLLVGGNGEPDLSPKAGVVTARDGRVEFKRSGERRFVSVGES